MDCTRNELVKKQEIINYFKSLGIEVHTTTKALGHQGFFRRNRIDVSRVLKEDRIIPTLIHEFSHYIVFNKKNIGNNNGQDSYCYFYNKDECLMAFYIPNCAPADKIQINENE